MRYEITRLPQPTFNRVGYSLRLYHPDGRPADFYLRYVHPYDRPRIWVCPDPLRFYGDDGRTVRAEAVAFAKAHIQQHYSNKE